jgi:hypothetical protein
MTTQPTPPAEKEQAMTVQLVIDGFPTDLDSDDLDGLIRLMAQHGYVDTTTKRARLFHLFINARTHARLTERNVP